MDIKEDSPPPKLTEKKKERVPSSEPIPYVGLTTPFNGDTVPIKETPTKKSGRQRRGQTATSTLQTTASEEVSR